MSLWQVAGLTCATCFIALILKHWREEFSFPLTLAAALALLSLSCNLLKPMIDFFMSVTESYAGLSRLRIPLQATCVALVSHFSSEICRENGYNLLGSAVDLASKVMILTLTLPLIKQIFQVMIRWGS